MTHKKEVGRVKLSGNQDSVNSLLNDDKLNLRIFLDTDSYKGSTKKRCAVFISECRLSYLINRPWNRNKQSEKELLENRVTKGEENRLIFGPLWQTAASR